MEHILPYKIGRVLFVPNTSGIVSQAKECVVSSSMARDNKLELLQLKQNTLSHSSSKSLESPITDMKWLEKNSLLVGDEQGQVSFVRLSTGQLDIVQTWSKLRKSITALAVINFGALAGAAATEDGKIGLLTLDEPDFVRYYEDDCAILSMTALSSTTVASGNLFGQVKWWDVRTAETRPERTFDLDEPGQGVSCLAQHPGRTNLVVGGTTDGAIVVWDARSDKTPVSTLKKHAGPVLEMKFHAHRPIAISCGSDGKLFAYGGDWSGTIEDHDLTPARLNESINSLDLSDDFIAAAGDNGILSVSQLD